MNARLSRKAAAIVTFALVICLGSATGALGYTAGGTSDTVITVAIASPAGTRVLSAITTFATANFGSTTAGLSGALASVTATVVETAADGSPGWYVDAVATPFRLSTNPSVTFTASALSIASQAPSSVGQVAGFETTLGYFQGTPAAGESGTLNAARKLYTVNGQVAGTFPGYSGIYTGGGALSLTIPAGTSAGTYTSTMTVTLWQ